MALNSYINFSKSKNQRPRAILLLIITAILWSLGGMLIKSVNIHPLAIAGVRSIIASGVFLVLLGKPKINGSTAQIGAAISYAGTVILFVLATKATTAANAIFLQYTAPIYVALLSSWLLKEKIRVLDWVTVFLVFGGMALFFLDNLSPTGILGNIFGLASGICFAFEAIFLRMQKDGSPWESVFLGNLLTAVIGLPFLTQAWPNTFDWVELLILGVVQLGISYVLYSIAIKHTTAIEAILIPVIEPILNPVWVLLFVGEKPGFWAIVGGITVLAAITIRGVLVEMPISSRKKIISQNEKC
ncbi:DMT family transporter [Desulfitobacterium sp.]|uniref:DMT family transporter n=1 Tax=Desulfitobacterium sp. TaxID=49981 RepID=UPI002B20F067|nr:DMT family transporter [Desulfitobacterium sp.]MEA4902239.1 DMT family transporter [Desulfitobacterium sp.]